jgi:hypothetical protein
LTTIDASEDFSPQRGRNDPSGELLRSDPEGMVADVFRFAYGEQNDPYRSVKKAMIIDSPAINIL